MEHSEHHWEQQREQLSALLDDELDTQQRAELEAHLATCAECRAELASLRRTRALVRALPQPALPRSFALPPAAAPIHQFARQTTPAPVRRARQRHPVQVLQWISTIAAVLGIVVLLSSAFASHAISNGATATSSLGANQQPSASTEQPASAPTSLPERTASTHPELPSPVPTAEPTNATPGTNQGSPHSSAGTAGPDLGSLISSAGLGALLLILSVCGFAIAWALRRRW